jgi:flavodoxin
MLFAVMVIIVALAASSCASPASDANSSATVELSMPDESATAGGARVLIILAASPAGATARVAGVIAEELGARVIGPGQAEGVRAGDFTLVGFGSGVFHGEHHASLLALADELPSATHAKAFLFSTCGIPARFTNPRELAEYSRRNHVALRERLRAKGYEIVGEFGCPGFNENKFLKLFGGLNRGRPNAADLESARSFAAGLEKYLSSP